MSTNIIFNVPGRTTNYMPIDVNTSKDVILEKYARESYSTENDWPYPSPSAGYYDITNSDTKLILLNNQMTWSHLRGKTKAKREPFVKDQFYDWVEREYEMKKQQEKSGITSRSQSKAKRFTDPSRHFTALGCSYKPEFNEVSSMSFKNTNTKSTISTARPRSGLNEKQKEMKKEDEKELLDYLFHISNQKTGLQDKTHLKHPPLEYINSYNINHPDIKGGQRLYMNNLCQVYSVYPMKKVKQVQYLKLLQQQQDVDKHSREKFKMHEGVDFDSYKEWISTERPVPHTNCGYFNPKKFRAPGLINIKPTNAEQPKQYASVYESASDLKMKRNKNLKYEVHTGRSGSSSILNYTQDTTNQNTTYNNTTTGGETTADEKKRSTSSDFAANNRANRVTDMSVDNEKNKQKTSAINEQKEKSRSRSRSASISSRDSSKSSNSSKSSHISNLSKSSETLKSLEEGSRTQSRFSLSSSTFSKSSNSSRASSRASSVVPSVKSARSTARSVSSVSSDKSEVSSKSSKSSLSSKSKASSKSTKSHKSANSSPSSRDTTRSDFTTRSEKTTASEVHSKSLATSTGDDQPLTKYAKLNKLLEETKSLKSNASNRSNQRSIPKSTDSHKSRSIGKISAKSTSSSKNSVNLRKAEKRGSFKQDEE